MSKTYMSPLELAITIVKHARSGHTEAILAAEVIRLHTELERLNKKAPKG